MKTIEPMNFFAATQHIHEVVFSSEASEFYSHLLDSSLNEVLSSLANESNVSGEFDEIIAILRRLKGNQMFNIMMNHVTNSNDKWNVFTHGDLWINNILFHYGNNGKVNDAKFVDLQTIRYGNMVCDILIFLFSSTKIDMRMRHMDNLIEVYRESLINNLRQYLKNDYSCEFEAYQKLFTFENIKNEIAKSSLYGFFYVMWVLPAITFVPNVKDIDSLMKTIMDSDKHDEIMASLQSNEYHIRIRDVIREFDQRGFLRNIFIDA